MSLHLPLVLLLGVATLAGVAAACPPAPATPSVPAPAVPEPDKTVKPLYTLEWPGGFVDVYLVADTYAGAYTLRAVGWAPWTLFGRTQRLKYFEIATIVNGKSPIPFQFGSWGWEFKLIPVTNWGSAAKGGGVKLQAWMDK